MRSGRYAWGWSWLMVCLAGGAGAQPFGGWLALDGRSGAVAVPSSPALGPSDAITIEGWVLLHATAGDCKSIAGKNAQKAWWVGVCGGDNRGAVLRAALAGAGSAVDGGVVPFEEWTHFAVVFDGVRQSHYIDGEMAAAAARQGPLPASGDELEIGGDVSLAGHTPDARLNEIRLWGVARSQEQVRATLNVAVATPQPGLIAVWSLARDGSDALGGHGGTVEGAAQFGAPVGTGSCKASAVVMCLAGRFAVSVRWRIGDPGDPTTLVTGNGQVAACAKADSGLFWFFSAENWELLVKTVDGCKLNRHHWIFSAATTNVSYRMEVVDSGTGASRLYFNYPGPPAPAVTDTDAFATCP